VMFCGMPAFAQDPPDVAMGMSPSATYHGGDFDSVDMATGRLNLNIPLVVDHSQRGKLNFTHSTTYTSTGAWSALLFGRASYLIEPPKYGVAGPAYDTDGWLGYNLTSDHYTDDAGDKYTAWSIYEGAGYGVGPKHPLGSTSNNTKMESIDGSGILISGTTAISKEGIQYPLSTPAPVVDPNGNEIFGNTSLDTLGRTWTFPTTSSSDVTGCPTGGLVAPTYSTVWTDLPPKSAHVMIRHPAHSPARW
jgi:hypothetical protein